MYFFKIKDELQALKKCCFITGSSNLTKAGLSRQNEFKVEISDYGTVEAEQYFDELWKPKNSVKITEDDVFKRELIEVLTKATLLAEVTPYETFAFVLKTYLELHKPVSLKEYVFQLLDAKGYRRYRYQIDAVAQAYVLPGNDTGISISNSELERQELRCVCYCTGMGGLSLLRLSVSGLQRHALSPLWSHLIAEPSATNLARIHLSLIHI